MESEREEKVTQTEGQNVALGGASRKGREEVVVEFILGGTTRLTSIHINGFSCNSSLL